MKKAAPKGRLSLLLDPDQSAQSAYAVTVQLETVFENSWAVTVHTVAEDA
jgi:hypothetical protein